MTKKFYTVLAYTLLTIGAVSMLMPFLWMLATSLMTQKQIFSYPPELIPSPLHIQNYSEVAKSIPVVTYFINSAVVAVITTIGQLVIASMAGYAFARLSFKYREPLFLLFLATTMIPPQVNIVPLFFIMRELGWIDTYQALIVPGLFGGFGIFLMRQWFKTWPAGLEEAQKKLTDANPLQKHLQGCNASALPQLQH